MTKIAVMGAAGRMGKRLVALTLERPTTQLVGALEQEGHPAVGHDAGEEAGIGTAGIAIRSALSDTISLADAIIDFTVPQATLAHMRLAAEHRTAMVIGTTGFQDAELQELQDLAKTIPCVFAPNMSVGVNVLLNIVGKVAQALGDTYDIEVIEAHHNQKKDAPSGTALKIGEVLAESMGRQLSEVGSFARHGIIGARDAREIGMQTIRAGDIVGDHTVLYGGPGERIEITHRAHTRDTFATGAIRAAEWAATQPPGLYSMAQVLGL